MYNMFVKIIRGNTMKNIKYFKYINTKQFIVFLKDYGYCAADVDGFNLIAQKQYRGNTLKMYAIFLKDGEYEYFKVVCFKSFNEYHQARLGFNSNRLLNWYEDANVRMYKVCEEYVIVK